MTATDRLNAMQARCDAATEGPWEVYRYEHGGGRIAVEGDPGGRRRGLIADVYHQGDREFLLAARTDLPATIAALRAVLDLHGAVQATWATKTGVGPFPFACEECSDVMWVPHPCPTVAAITKALT